MHPENLKRGDWVAVVGLVEPSGWTDEDERCVASFNGKPVQVILYEAPFLVVENLNGRRGALDLREVKIQRFSRKYASAIHGKRRRVATGSRRAAQQTQEKSDPRTCQRCGGHVTALLVVGRGWIPTCRDCGHRP